MHEVDAAAVPAGGPEAQDQGGIVVALVEGGGAPGLDDEAPRDGVCSMRPLSALP